MMPEPQRRVIDRWQSLSGKVVSVGQTGTEYKGYCLSHPDEAGGQPSLTVGWKDGRVVFHCWCGCKEWQILAVLGLTEDEIYEGYERPKHSFHRNYRPTPGHPTLRIVTPPPVDPEVSANLAAECERCAQNATDEGNIAELAAELGVTPQSLIDLGVGWRDRCGKSRKAPWSEPHYTFPFRAADASIVGIQGRWADGSKRTQFGTHNGLIFAPSIADVRSGIILNVEGASCTAAAATLGLNAIGRSSNRGDGEAFGELVGPCCWDGNAEVLILGENDQKVGPDGKPGLWPGRDGMEKVARDVANRLGMPVLMALPPVGSKDLRDWLVAQHANLDDVEQLTELGRQFLALVLPTATTVWPDGLAEGYTDPSLYETNAHFPKVRSFKAGKACTCELCGCKHGRAIELYDKEDEDEELIDFKRCWMWLCEDCAIKLRERWELHFSQVLWNTDEPLYFWTGIPKKWTSLAKHLRDHDGNYFHVKIEHGRHTIVATVPFLDAVPVTRGQAINELSRALRSITPQKKPVSTSRAWKLGRQEDKSGRWKKKRDLGGSTPVRVSLILRDTLIPFQGITPTMPGACWYKIRFRIPAEWDEQQRILFELAMIGDHPEPTYNPMGCDLSGIGGYWENDGDGELRDTA